MTDLQAQVNRPLFYALQLLSIEQDGQANFGPQMQRALYAGIDLLLSQAWISWLQEFSTYIHVDLSDWASLEQPPARELPESQCLMSLHNDPESWLSLLLVRVTADNKGIIQLQVSSALKDMSLPASNRINLIAVEKDDETEQELLNRIIVDFKQYIQSVRSRQIEW